MKRTSIAALVGTFVLIQAAVAIIAFRFYHLFPPVPTMGAVTVWVLAAICVVLIVVVRSHLKDHNIGLDRTQMDPMTVARFMVVGKASAWTGTIIGGLYTGVATYVVPRASELVAASNDLPAVVTAAAGAVVLVIAGVVLERNCETPPPPDAQANS